MHIRIPQSRLSRYRQESKPPAGQLRARQFVHEAAHTDAMRDGLMPRQQPEAAIAGKKKQSIRRLDTRTLKNHHSDQQNHSNANLFRGSLILSVGVAFAQPSEKWINVLP